MGALTQPARFIGHHLFIEQVSPGLWGTVTVESCLNLKIVWLIRLLVHFIILLNQVFPAYSIQYLEK